MGSSAFGDLTVIANPFAGNGAVRERLPDLERLLSERDLPFTTHVLERREDASTVAREALLSGSRFLVAVGGDGTVQEVVNGMLEDGRPIAEEAVLGVISAGARCDLLRTFGLPEELDRAVGHLTGENVYPFDLMKIAYTDDAGERRMRYAHNLSQVGLGGAVARRLRHLPPWTGRSRSFLGFWLTFLRTRIVQVKVQADKKAYEGPAFDVVVANGQFTGGELFGGRGVRLSPRSFPGDGVLDALVFTGPRSDAVTMLPRIFCHGDHVPDPHIRELRAKIRVAVEAERPLAIVADGELLGTTPATFQVVPQPIALKL